MEKLVIVKVGGAVLEDPVTLNCKSINKRWKNW